uniref:Uncharacterized protein n=1 Tax=Oncorhynchus tshawytscha TaxID=74940 RepID=A0A8C8C6B0_ONCTS
APCGLSLLPFNLDFYTDVMDLTYLLDHLAADPFFRKFLKLNEKFAGVIQDYSLVSFVPFNVQDRESMTQVLRTVDKERNLFTLYPLLTAAILIYVFVINQSTSHAQPMKQINLKCKRF